MTLDFSNNFVYGNCCPRASVNCLCVKLENYIVVSVNQQSSFIENC